VDRQPATAVAYGGRVPPPRLLRWRAARWWLPPFVLVVALGTAAVVLVWWVRVPPAPTRADAVVVLGGNGARLDRGLALTRSGTAPVLVLPAGVLDGGCRHLGEPVRGAYVPVGRLPAVPGVAVECLDPVPFTTQGEARGLIDLARSRGWHRVVVVSTNDQANRAWLRVRRCERPQNVVMVGFSLVGSGSGVLTASAYQLAGWAKALVTERGC